MNDEIVLKARNISKSFPGVKALDSVCLELRKGEVHALCGENGAGKSTLLKVLTGIYAMDEGEIFIDEQKVDIKNITDARRNGVHVVPQEMAMANHLTVAENIFIGRYPEREIRGYRLEKDVLDGQGSSGQTRRQCGNAEFGFKSRTAEHGA